MLPVPLGLRHMLRQRCALTLQLDLAQDTVSQTIKQMPCGQTIT